VAVVALVAGLVRPRLPHEGFTPRAEEVLVGLAARQIMPKGERALIEVVGYGHLAIDVACGTGGEPHAAGEDAMPVQSLVAASRCS